MWLCRFIFGDCLPLSLALHHLLTTINRATATPIFLDSLLNTQGRAHTIAQCLEYPGATQWQTAVMSNHPPQKNRSPPPPRSLLPPPLRDQRQRQRRPQRAPIPKNQQPQPLESKHHRRGEVRRLWLFLPKGKAPVWK